MSAGLIFDALKMHLKARGMTYADVARALKLSEATVKRIFATRNCTLARLDELCDLIQVDMAELARSAPKRSRLINRLSPEQERELMSDPALLLVAGAKIMIALLGSLGLLHQMRSGRQALLAQQRIP